jgi:hypothetical protein
MIVFHGIKGSNENLFINPAVKHSLFLHIFASPKLKYQTMKIRFTTTILLLCLCLPVMMFAQSTHYVSTTGDNANTGSESSPWQTIQHAIYEAAPGDIIEVATGTYTETLSIGKSLTINGAEGTIVKPPAYDPIKIINGYGSPLVSIFSSERKSALPEKSSYGTVIITGIEFDCDFNPSIHTGIEATFYDLVLDNIKVHSIQQLNYEVFGINIYVLGRIVIANSKIYDIISISDIVEQSFAAKAIHINGSQLLKSDHDDYDIVIQDNELYDIVSVGDDAFIIFFDTGSAAIQINNASKVLIEGNNIYSTSSFNIMQKDLSEDPIFTGPSTGILLVGLDGDNTVSDNEFSSIPIAGIIVATSFIVVEDNEVNNCLIGFFGFGLPPPGGVAKSASPIPQINIKLPVISPLKTNKYMIGGTWEFNNNHFGTNEELGWEGAFAIAVLNFTGLIGPAKSSYPFDVKIVGNQVLSKEIGIMILNNSAGSYEVSGNVFKSNRLGLNVQNVYESDMLLDVSNNEFIDNLYLGMGLFNVETTLANIHQNLFEGNTIGMMFESGDYSSISVNNNKIINSLLYGISFRELQYDLKNNSTASLDATCNWWGTINPTLISGMVEGDVEVFPYLLSDVTDSEDPAFMCGHQEFAMVPLSTHGLLLSILLIAGFSLFLVRSRPI